MDEEIKNHYVDQSGAYLGDLAEAPVDALVVPNPPARADQKWNGERWAYPMRLYVDGQGVYLGELEETTEPEGAVEVTSPPKRADQKWNGERWAYPSWHYARPDGTYAGAIEECEAPPEYIETRCAPIDATEQLWRANQWQWKIHYWRDEVGNFLGASDLPNKPAGAIEVDADDLPEHGEMKFANGVWAHTPEFLAVAAKEAAAIELAALRVTIPDAMESMWTAMNFDTSTLDAAMRSALARKRELVAFLA